MMVSIEFYRTRETDDAHAVVGREVAEAVDLETEISIARSLAQSLDMPQRPDAMRLLDATGATLYSGSLEAGAPLEGGQS